MTSFAIHATEPTELDTLFVDRETINVLNVQDCLQVPVLTDSQLTNSSCTNGAIVYHADEIKARIKMEWETLATAESILSVAGPEGAIQLSDGNGGLTFESNLTSTVKIHRVDHGASFITLEEL